MARSIRFLDNNNTNNNDIPNEKSIDHNDVDDGEIFGSRRTSTLNCSTKEENDNLALFVEQALTCGQLDLSHSSVDEQMSRDLTILFQALDCSNFLAQPSQTTTTTATTKIEKKTATLVAGQVLRVEKRSDGVL